MALASEVYWQLFFLFLTHSDARLMAPDVNKTIKEIIMEEGDKTQAESDDYIKKMQSKGRYSCDVWS